jgi:hypothetical protein
MDTVLDIPITVRMLASACTAVVAGTVSGR